MLIIRIIIISFASVYTFVYIIYTNAYRKIYYLKVLFYNSTVCILIRLEWNDNKNENETTWITVLAISPRVDKNLGQKSVTNKVFQTKYL